MLLLLLHNDDLILGSHHDRSEILSANTTAWRLYSCLFTIKVARKHYNSTEQLNEQRNRGTC